MQQKRLLLALIISSAILILWTFFYPAPPASQKPGATPSPTASPAETQQTETSNNNAPAPTTTLAPNVSTAPQRTITVKTPLYDVKFGTLGAEPVSWIIKVNKNSQNEKEVYSVAGRKSDKKPLELISPEGLKRQPRMVPLQLQSGDAALDAALASSTYRVEGIDQASGDVEVNVSKDEKKELTFVY